MYSRSHTNSRDMLSLLSRKCSLSRSNSSYRQSHKHGCNRGCKYQRVHFLSRRSRRRWHNRSRQLAVPHGLSTAALPSFCKMENQPSLRHS